MESDELQRIASIFSDNRCKAEKYLSGHRQEIAIVATVVDILRADAKKDMTPNEKDEKKKTESPPTFDAPSVFVEILGLEYPRLPTFLTQMGCILLTELEGYRVETVEGVSCSFVRFGLLISGNFVVTNSDFTPLDMEQLKDAYEKHMGRKLIHFQDVSIRCAL